MRLCELLWVLLQFDKEKAHQQVRGNNRKRWLAVLLGLFIPVGMAVAQAPVDSIPPAVSPIDSIASVKDTVSAAVQDSIPKGPKKKKDALEDPVVYE